MDTFSRQFFPHLSRPRGPWVASNGTLRPLSHVAAYIFSGYQSRPESSLTSKNFTSSCSTAIRRYLTSSALQLRHHGAKNLITTSVLRFSRRIVSYSAFDLISCKRRRRGWSVGVKCPCMIYTNDEMHEPTNSPQIKKIAVQPGSVPGIFLSRRSALHTFAHAHISSALSRVHTFNVEGLGLEKHISVISCISRQTGVSAPVGAQLLRSRERGGWWKLGRSTFAASYKSRLDYDSPTGAHETQNGTPQSYANIDGCGIHVNVTASLSRASPE